MLDTYRLWSKSRVDIVKAWDRQIDCPFFYGSSGRASSKAAWEHLLYEEVAAASEQAVITILLDVEKCYEHITHQQLVDEAYALGFPTAILRIAVEAYRGPRRLVAKQAVSERVEVCQTIVLGAVLPLSCLKPCCVARLQASLG